MIQYDNQPVRIIHFTPAHLFEGGLLETATPGDTLYLAAGEYRGNVSVGVSVALVGEGSRAAA